MINEEKKDNPILSKIKKRFGVNNDLEHKSITIESISQDVELSGSKLWILIAAILIASLGLNTNSTAVIIGAMLISPLMGPIIGFGLAMGIYDIDLLRKSAKNLILTAIFSVFTAMLFFIFTPFGKENSELLARTTPTFLDVLIALSGGFAGILALSSRNKGNVITGVAIATALMPPLCTAGYGLATLQFRFFFGALFLFIINSVFIALATYLFVRATDFPQKKFVDKEKEKRIHRIVLIISLMVIIPSLYLGYVFVQDGRKQDAINRFVSEHIDKDDHPVIKQNIDDNGNVEVIVFGKELDKSDIDSIMMLKSDMIKDVNIVIKQSLQNNNLSTEGLKSLIMKDFYENSQHLIDRQNFIIDSLEKQIASMNQIYRQNTEIDRELKAIYPNILSANILAMSDKDILDADKSIIIIHTGNINANDKKKIQDWMAVKLNSEKINIIFNQIKQ